MIRRNLSIERDPRILTWSLVAAVFALSVGCYADMVLSVDDADRAAATTTVVGESVSVEPPVTVAG
ncbi:hypothetical protein BH23GEM10_BH23GEM10_06950 [soil metagenome]